MPADGSHASFIIEHYWGYTKLASGNTNEYRVAHPKWEMFEPRDIKIDVNYGKVYGDKFAFLGDTQPYSVLLAAGSEVAVYMGKSIDT